MKKKNYKSLFYVFLFLAILFFIGNLYFFILLYSQCAAGDVFLSPARIPYFLIVFFAGFFLLCFAGWYIAFRYSY